MGRILQYGDGSMIQDDSTLEGWYDALTYWGDGS